MRKFYFGTNGKLVRNRILQLCLEDPLVIETKHKKLSNDKHVELLRAKLREEAEEVIEAQTREELIEELADIQEVLDEIKVRASISQKDLSHYRSQKVSEKGDFSEGIFIEYVLLDDKSSWIEKFATLTDKYREDVRKPLFVTGNEHKADYIERLLGVPIDYQKLNVDEIQSKSPEDVIAHKVKQAYAITKRPVFVDDFLFWFDDLDGLPGPFIKFFIEQDDSLEKLCRLADSLPSRRVTGRSYFGYYDGVELAMFYGEIKGEIVDHPRGTDTHGIGTDFVFAVDGYGGRTRSELSADEYDEVYRTVRPIEQFREFLGTKQ